MEILLFKTNIDKCKLARLQTILNGVIGIKEWTIDLGDCDKVLRIISVNVSEEYISIILKSEGFECVTMTYEL
ncbi:hypothetical protein [Ohtaekwangia koreensis]|uniref:HMA domain-containing protein n=1 Tax=Ohtaekwangia koreensis TaxID=688867 RepID=A0A1T5M5K7_9BACT|nr:hypothetical protein [Ohtaekwangia koreensis]SKC83413.1 hypothetical protein SAMN05660236_4448 [Ohtaekwangia koreensis]